MKKTKIKVIGMHCGSCEKLIEGVLKETAGVMKAEASHKKQTVEVKFDEARINEKDISEIIALEGYKVI